MTILSYQEKAGRTMPEPGAQHWFSLEDYQGWTEQAHQAHKAAEKEFPGHIDIIHAALGMAGEAGEVVEHVKKAMFYGKPLDEAKLKEEAGDLLWYIAGPLCRALGCTLEELAAANVAKLEKRYPEKYSDLAAIRRVDVNEPKPRPEVPERVYGLKLKELNGATVEAVLDEYFRKYGAANVDAGHYFSEEDHCWFPIPELWEELRNGS